MSRKTKIIKKITSMLLVLTIALSGLFIAPITVRAAGWLDYAQDLTLGTAVSGTIKEGDYHGSLESSVEFGGEYYWHIYKFTMPQDGLLNMYIECKSKDFFANVNADGYAIFSGSDPDNVVWCTYQRHNELPTDYSSARAMYSKTAELSLKEGIYYFTIRKYSNSDAPYYITLSYKEPNVNVTSISLDKKSIKLEPGEQNTLTATVLPDNATDKTVVWESSDTSVASVENGIVTANSPGSSTITAASSDGEITASCLVTVIDTAAIDELEEAKPAITSLTVARKKATVYLSSTGISDVKYQVAYKTGSSAWKIKNTASTSVTIRSLKSKKTYSVRVRGYKNIDGKVYYSSWSAVKRVKVK